MRWKRSKSWGVASAMEFGQASDWSVNPSPTPTTPSQSSPQTFGSHTATPASIEYNSSSRYGPPATEL
eukprot:366534-Chlamydomonas_euryale.AAC.3